MSYNRGDVVLVLFPDSSLKAAKRRPALVVQADRLNTGIPQTIIAMITSNMARAGHPSRITVRNGTAEAHSSGLRTDSVIATDNLATVLNVAIDRTIGSYPDRGALDAALRHTFGL